MVDTQLFWYKIKEWLAKMADKVTDYVYTDSSKETVDVINLLLLGWILLGLVIYVLGSIIATQLKKRKAKQVAGPAPADSKEELPCFEETVAATTVRPTESKLSSTSEIFVNSSTPKPLITPICSGDDSDLVDWINSVFTWIYNQHIVSPLLDSWLLALNARTRLSSAEYGVLVDFKSVVLSNEPPVVTEAFENIDNSDKVNVSCYFEALKLVFNLLVTQVKEKEKKVYKFILSLKRLAGQVNIECDPVILSFVARFSEIPQVELTVDANPENPVLPEDYEPLRNLVAEIAADSFIAAVIEQNFATFSECPKYQKPQISADDNVEIVQKEKKERLLVKVVKASNLGISQSSTRPYCVIEMDEPAQRFETIPVDDAASPFWDESFVFILKGTTAELLFEIYDKNRPNDGNFLGLCIVSIEELAKNPSQRQIIPLQSRPLEKDNVSGTLTAEFLFLDRDIPTPEVTQLGQNQAKTDSNGKVIETNSRVTAGGTIITTTTIKRTAEGTNGNISEPKENLPILQNGNVLGISRQNFLKQMIHNSPLDSELHDSDDDGQKTPENEPFSEPSDLTNSNVEAETESVAKPCMNGMCGSTGSVNLDIPEMTNTLHDSNEILHAEKKPAETLHDSQNSITNLASKILNPPGMFRDNELGSSTSTLIDHNQNDDEITETALKELEKSGKSGSTNKSMLIIHSVQRADNSHSGNIEASPGTHPSGDSQSSQAGSTPPSPSRLRNGVDRSRPKVKKSLIRNLRKKLSFRKPRSRSMEAQDRLNASPVPGAENNRSVSSDRAKSPQEARDSSSLRSGRKRLALAGSSRSSFSEASGLSTASSRTYINENSTLVIEVNENGIIKRYLIPTSMIHRSKWKKRGIKLHLFNDHVFVAKHLSGNTLCNVCKKYLTRRPGKQGYECRDCNLQCHKSCHVKVPEYCPNSSVTTMEVEYIHDPRLTKPKAT